MLFHEGMQNNDILGGVKGKNNAHQNADALAEFVEVFIALDIEMLYMRLGHIVWKPREAVQAVP